MLFLSPEDIKFELIGFVEKSPAEVTNIVMMRKTQLIGLHHTFGAYIRNTYNLWHKDNPLTQNYEQYPLKHPDEVSYNLIVAVWEHFNK